MFSASFCSKRFFFNLSSCLTKYAACLQVCLGRQVSVVVVVTRPLVIVVAVAPGSPLLPIPLLPPRSVFVIWIILKEGSVKTNNPLLRQINRFHTRTHGWRGVKNAKIVNPDLACDYVKLKDNISKLAKYEKRSKKGKIFRVTSLFHSKLTNWQLNQYLPF